MTNKSLLCEGNSLRKLYYILRNHQRITTICNWVGHPERRVSMIPTGPQGPHSGRFKELTAQTNPHNAFTIGMPHPQQLPSDSPTTPHQLPIKTILVVRLCNNLSLSGEFKGSTLLFTPRAIWFIDTSTAVSLIRIFSSFNFDRSLSWALYQDSTW